MDSYSYIDFNIEANAVIQWLEESRYARIEYQRWLWRSSLAELGMPCRNLYQEELKTNLGKLEKGDQNTYKEYCKEVPEGRSFALKKAADNIANQMASGVDTYEYHINDPYMVIEPDTEDLLSAKCKQDYIENKLSIYSATFSRDLTWKGMAAVVVKYDPVHDKNIIFRVNPKNIWFDTKYSSTGQERFRGYSQMISWKKLKKMIVDDDDEINLDIKAPDKSIFREEKDEKGRREFKLDKTAKYSNRKIRTLNGLDIYVEDLNHLAASTQLSGGLEQWGEYDHDLRTCYNLNWYRSWATDVEKRTNSPYNGDDVELTVIYDLTRKVEYKVINRRFIISANKKAFRRKIAFEIINPITGEKKTRLDDFCLDCPLKIQYEEQENMDKFPHPVAPVFPLLDTHDQLCAWRAKREHVSKILSILRIATNGADATSLRGVLNIMGVVLDDIQGDISSINFAYSYDPIDSEIAHLENRIQQLLHAYDQFDALQAMGDRASAAESGMALSAVAQGLSTHQNAIMQLYSDIARQCIANRVAYSPNQEFAVSNFGGNSSITIQQMALDAIIDVKPLLAKKVQEKAIAANAMQLLGTIGAQLKPEGMAYLMEQVLMGTMPRKMAESFIVEQQPSEQEIALAQQQAKNEADALAQNQQMYERNPRDYEVENIMESYSPDEVDSIIEEMGAQQAADGEEYDYQETSDDITANPGSPQGLDMMSQDGAMTTGGVQGLTPESGAMYANPNAMVG